LILFLTIQNAANLFSKQLEPFINNLEGLYTSCLSPVRFSQTIFYDTDAFEFDFLAKAITSHMQTHGCTVITGNDEIVINKFVDTLSLLISGAEKKRSARVVPNRGYVPDLVLQGIVGPVISDERVIQSTLPTTLIDLQQMTIKQTHPFHEYAVLRREFLNMEIEKLVSMKSKDNLWTTQDGLFHPIKASAACVEKLLTETFRLPMELREGFIVQYLRLLSRRAVVMIKYVEAELEKAKSPNLEASIVKKIRSDLDLTAESDFAVLLGIAEKLSPGMYVALAGDPASIEAKFVELFESF